MSGAEIEEKHDFYRWKPERTDDPRLRRAVEGFQPVDVPAGQAACTFLLDEALREHPATATWLMVSEDGVLDGFYALCAGQVTLSTSDRAKRLGVPFSHPTVPAILLAWFAKRDGASSAATAKLFEHALAMARQGAEQLGALVLALDPYDEGSVGIWRGERYRFKSARTEGADGIKRLWRPLFARGEPWPDP